MEGFWTLGNGRIFTRLVSTFGVVANGEPEASGGRALGHWPHWPHWSLVQGSNPKRLPQTYSGITSEEWGPKEEVSWGILPKF